MARKYDDYGYEENEYYKKSGVSLVKKVLIILMVVIAILLIIYLVKGCTKTRKPSNNNGNNANNYTDPVTFDYESQLVKGAKDYYLMYQEELPSSMGECSIVELESLLSRSLVDSEKFGNCNVNTTYVKVCKLESGTYHYTPWLNCINKNSDNEYGVLKEGTNQEIIADKTYVEFKFMPQESTKDNLILGDKEEMWKDEIPYESYKTLDTTKFYRFRDKLYIWKLINRNYYTSYGTQNKASKVNEYYTSSPNSKYKLNSDRTTSAYKWYKSKAKKEYYTVNGVKTPSPTAVGEYNIKDPNGYDATRYRTRTVTGTYSPTRYYGCSTSASSNIIKYQQVKCGTGSTPEYKVTREEFYSCAKSTDLVKTSAHVLSSHTCKSYSSWSGLTTKKCDTKKSDICESYTITFYYWYKITNDVRSYYPSGSSKASGENVYYVNEPFKGAIKDTSTKATAYKWYNETTKYSNEYTALAPKGYTITKKTSDYKWSSWSDWKAKNPKVSDGREREIEKKTKIKLQEIKGTTSSSWNNLSTDYLTEEELIKLFKSKGYKVNTLEDIINNGQIKYQLKLYLRNKKESK